jgi:hypothetical protein
MEKRMLMTKHATWLGLALASLAVGCAEEIGEELGSISEAEIGDDGNNDDTGGAGDICDLMPTSTLCRGGKQGPSLTGTLLYSRMRVYSGVSPRGAHQTFDLQKHGLLHRNWDTSEPFAFLDEADIGTTFEGFRQANSNIETRLRVTSVSRPFGKFYRYGLEYQSRTAGSSVWSTPRRYCSRAEDKALAMPGAVTWTGVPVGGGSGEFSFVCESSAVAKAMTWGYSAWLGNQQFTIAAIQMARADYCGDGTGHTVLGTDLQFFDLNEVARIQGEAPAVPEGSADHHDGEFVFEAAWSGGLRKWPPDPADEFPVVPQGKVVCLSKLRWQSLPFSAMCGFQLRDPRTRGFGDVDTSVFFCDEHMVSGEDPTAELTFLRNVKGARVFSLSRINERGLWIWNRGHDTLATTAGFWGGNAGGTVIPAPGYLAGPEQSPDGLRPIFLAAVLNPRKDGSSPWTQTPNVALRVYKNSANGDYATSTTRPAGDTWIEDAKLSPAGYVFLTRDAVPPEFEPVELRQTRKPLNQNGAEDYLLWPANRPLLTDYAAVPGASVWGFRNRTFDSLRQ